MTGQRIGNARTKFDFGSVQRHGGHINVGLTPDEVRVTDPNMAKAQFFSELGQMDYSWQRLRRKETDAEFKIAHSISSLTACLGCDSFRRRCLLTASGDTNFPVDDHHRNARQITLTKRLQRILRY